MKEINVLVVDDSPFSVAMLSNILTRNGFNVVGGANCLEEAEKMVSELKPDVVTMDMTMPDNDGLVCTKAIRKINPDVKVIIVSSMMDDEIIREAKKANVCGYLQKPVDEEELALLINRIMAEEELFVELENLYQTIFKEGMTDSLNKLFKTVPTFKEESSGNKKQSSRGISVVIGIVGQYDGRMIIDASKETAKNMTNSMLKMDNITVEYMVNVMSEFANIVAGNACSFINKCNKLFGLRVAPPTTVYGEEIKISKSDFDSGFSVIASTEFGDIYMNVGFKRGELKC